ncbi:protein translocase subunit [Sorochytrium milnesiophthora]
MLQRAAASSRVAAQHARRALPSSSSSTAPSARLISTSRSLRQRKADSTGKQDEQEQQQQQQQQQQAGDAPNPEFKGFFSEFASSVRRQVQENKQLKDNVKLLQAESQKISESETLRRAKETLEKAKKESGPAAEAVIKTAKTVKKGVETVSESVRKTVDAAAETEIGKATSATVKSAAKVAGKAAKATAQATAKVAAPIIENPTVQAVSEDVSKMIDESASRYGGLPPRSTRQAIRKERLRLHELRMKYIADNPDAGLGLVLHAQEESKWKQAWTQFRDTNPLTRSLFSAKQSMEQSDNPLVAWGRWIVEGVQDRLGGMFEETETAQTIAQLQKLDPSFKLDAFMKEAREFLIPELLEAYLGGDLDVLQEMCGEAAFNVLSAGIKEQRQQGLVSDSKVVDLRNVELAAAKVLDSQLPVLVISFTTQEIIVFRDRVTNEVKLGKEDHVERCTYAVVMTIEEGNLNPVTRGWKVIDVAKHESRPTW